MSLACTLDTVLVNCSIACEISTFKPRSARPRQCYSTHSTSPSPLPSSPLALELSLEMALSSAGCLPGLQVCNERDVVLMKSGSVCLSPAADAQWCA